MLPPFIIEQIRKREEETRRERAAEQPRLELPVAPPMPRGRTEEPDDDRRGVIVVDIA